MQFHEDNVQDLPRPSFDNYRDPKFRGRKSYKVKSILKSDTQHVNMRRLRKLAYSRHSSNFKHVPHSDFPSSPRVKRTSVHIDNSVSSNSKFKRREITTIHEEIVLYKTKSHSTRKDKKAHKDKVASLKNIVKRLREMGVAKKTESVQNKLPEDVMQLFSDIQL